MNNKIKRIAIVGALALSCSVLPVSAYATKVISSNNADVSLDGYINGTACNWNPFTYDSINYTAMIYGSDVQYVTYGTQGSDSDKVYVQASTDKKTFDRIYLGANRVSISRTDQNGGRNSSHANLKMHCLEAEDTISAWLD